MSLNINEVLKNLLNSSKEEPSIYDSNTTTIGKIIDVSREKYEKTENAFRELFKAFKKYTTMKIKSLNFNPEANTLKINYTTVTKTIEWGPSLIWPLFETYESELKSFTISKNKDKWWKYDVVQAVSGEDKLDISKIIDEICTETSYYKCIENAYNEYKEFSTYYSNNEKENIKLNETNMYLFLKYNKLFLKYIDNNTENRFSFGVTYDINNIYEINAENDIKSMLGYDYIDKIRSIHIDINSLPLSLRKRMLLDKKDKANKKNILRSIFGLRNKPLNEANLEEEDTNLKK